MRTLRLHPHVSRRRFLKAAAATGALAGLPDWFVEETLCARAAQTREMSGIEKV